MGEAKLNCWEFKKCGREPGGARADDLGICAAAVPSVVDGLNDGKFGGRMCWVVAGTLCGGKEQGTFAQKISNCLDCDFFAKVRADEDRNFKFLRPGHEFEEVSGVLAKLQDLIQRQDSAISELATPVLQVWDGVIVVPVIGVVDSRRTLDIMERLLQAVVELRASHVILDITGVAVVDTKTADYFVKLVRAAQMLGARCLLTGIQPPVAQTLVEIGVDLSGIRTRRNLQSGLRECLTDLEAKQ